MCSMAACQRGNRIENDGQKQGGDQQDQFDLLIAIDDPDPALFASRSVDQCRRAHVRE